jgi:hypothetical protein
MNTQTLIDRMMQLPQEIADVQTELLIAGQKAQEISNKISKCETKLRVQIASKTDEAGKKLYSNEDARKAAFVEMTEDDLELNELKEKNQDIETEIQKKKIDFDCLNNEQKNIRAVLTFLSGKGE